LLVYYLLLASTFGSQKNDVCHKHTVDNNPETLEFWYQPDIFDSAIPAASNTHLNQIAESDENAPQTPCPAPLFADTDSYPYSAAGALFARINWRNETRSCTAQYILSNLTLITSAHCVLVNRDFADQVIFVQQYDASERARDRIFDGIRRVKRIYIDPRFFLNFETEYDYAILEMMDESTGGYFDWSPLTMSSSEVTLSAIGYPTEHFGGKIMIRDPSGLLGGIAGNIFTKQGSSFGSADGAIGGAIFVDRPDGNPTRRRYEVVGLVAGAIFNSRCLIYSPTIEAEAWHIATGLEHAK